MSIITRLVTFTFILALAFNIVNLTGVFPVNTENFPVNYLSYQAEITQIATAFQSSTSTLSYLAAAAFGAITGLKILLQFALGLVGIYPALFHMFLIPTPLADLLGGTLDLVMLIGLAQMFRGR